MMQIRRCANFEKRWVTAAIVLSLVVMAMVAGCYRHEGLYDEQYRSVYVPIFENQTFYRGAEMDVTEALIKEIELRTPYKTTRSAVADTELIGTIRSIEQRRVNRRADIGVVQEVEISIIVDWEWKDVRSGEVIRSRRGFESLGRFVPTSPVGEVYDNAQHVAASRMARDITTAMQADW